MTDPVSSSDPHGLAALGARLRAWDPGPPAMAHDGRGIVIAAGGVTVFTNAYVLISVLRKVLDCRLPIEVWHFGTDELSPAMASLLAELDVATVDARPLIARHGEGIRDGWQLKPFAMLWSRFAEVLLLDADEVPVSDPAALFEWPEYRDAGAVFWPDIVELRETSDIWQALGLPPRRAVSLDSGQVLIDKRRHLRALQIVVALNQQAEQLYRLVYGDKDTFLLGWELAGAAHALVPHQPFRDDRMMVQRDFTGAPLFQHRTNAKWNYAGGQYVIDGAAHLPACLAALETLRQRWNGRIFNPPDRDAAARAVEAALVAAGPLRLAIAGAEPIGLELRPHGEIAAGRAYDRQNWWCEAAGEGFALCLSGPDGESYRLLQAEAQLWTGTSYRLPASAVTLTIGRQGRPAAFTGPGLVNELIRAADLAHDQAGLVALTAALVLLARIQPGVAAKLRRLAAEATDGSWSTALLAIASRIESEAGGERQPVHRDMAILQKAYLPVSGDAP